jgi:hypothetical protein
MDEAVRQFHLLCADGVDFEEISRMMEEEIVEVDCIDQVNPPQNTKICKNTCTTSTL